jgi:hypothetical protein
MLGGDGSRIFSVNLPYLHYASGTINSEPEKALAWAKRIEQSRAHYVRKWGGDVNHERFTIPFDAEDQLLRVSLTPYEYALTGLTLTARVKLGKGLTSDVAHPGRARLAVKAGLERIRPVHSPIHDAARQGQGADIADARVGGHPRGPPGDRRRGRRHGGRAARDQARPND